MIRDQIVEVVAGVGLAGVLSIGIWVGVVQEKLDHKADDTDYARLEQKVENNTEDLKEIKADTKLILSELRRRPAAE